MAITSCLEILDAVDGEVAELSPLFHYYFARANPDDLTPIDPRTALRIAASVGICLRSLHDVAYDSAGAATPPLREAIEDARSRRLVGYDPGTRATQYQLLTLPRVHAARHALAGRNPVLLGLWVTSPYEALHRDAPIHGWPEGETSDAGHAVVLVGYDDDRSVFLVEDSRGAEFARDGHWEMPYDLFESRLVYEAWALRRITYNT